jgi:hypothetical protein
MGVLNYAWFVVTSGDVEENYMKFNWKIFPWDNNFTCVSFSQAVATFSLKIWKEHDGSMFFHTLNQLFM